MKTNLRFARGVVAAVGGAGALTLALLAPPARSQVPTPQPIPTAGGVASAEARCDMQSLSNGFADVAQSVLPSVVSLSVEVEREAPQVQGLPFGLPFPFGGGEGRGRGGVEHGTGSGVIVRPDGVILTNNHVVRNARRITVKLRDGRQLPARVLGTDPATDLAVVQVAATNLPAARWGDSESARVGSWVLAIGAPFGLEATVTHGVLSATGRAGLGANQIEDYLQTDASINPGNSGGPLVNLRGEVLGINTMIIGRGTGVGFAVPTRLARQVVEQITTTGRVSRGWIGVGVQDLAAELATSLGVQPGSGAVVSQVDRAGPSARAGLQVGDVITAVDGHRATSSNDVVRAVTSRAPGDRVALSVLRRGQPLTVNVVAAPRPDAQRAAREIERAEPVPEQPSGSLGMEVAPLDRSRSRALGTSSAVVVTRVDPDGPAARAGLRRGDYILGADNAPVASSGDLVAATQDGRAALLVRRGDRQIFVPFSTAE
ncbi:MAG: trypsin-like peptidase domain-containing protein [Polyangiales bacterium]